MKVEYSIVLVCLLCALVNVRAWVFKTLLYSDWITCEHNKTLDLDVSLVEVYFYDFQNNYNVTYQVDSAGESISTNYNLDITRRLIFFVPGYKSHISKKTEELIRQTFKDVRDTYLIIIDHSSYTSKRGGKFKSYERSVLYSYYIGKALGQVLADIHRLGYPSNKIHAIGHSLGSQMLGYAGKEYSERTGEKLWRITGLDPAGPCFSNSFIEDQLGKGMAEYVEVYHCNSGGLGTTSVIADADFFINRALYQPHCSNSIIPGVSESDQAKCSHKKCLTYYAMTVHQLGMFLAWECDSYTDFSQGKCAGNEVAIAGYSNPGNATGVFYVSTETYGIF